MPERFCLTPTSEQAISLRDDQTLLILIFVKLGSACSEACVFEFNYVFVCVYLFLSLLGGGTPHALHFDQCSPSKPLTPPREGFSSFLAHDQGLWK